jgi:hypothetical protein
MQIKALKINELTEANEFPGILNINILKDSSPPLQRI